MNLKGSMFRFKQAFRWQSRHLVSELCINEQLSADEVAAINWRRRKLLLEAAMLSPFYKKRFDAVGLSVGDVKEEKDWENIPILTRQDIQEHMAEMVQSHVSPKELNISSTGGSTGVPLKLYRPKNIPYDAFAARMLDWWGVKMWEDSCYIFRHGYKGIRKAANNLMWWPTRRFFMNASNMDDKRCEEFYRIACHVRPTLMVGYVGAITAFADYLVRTRHESMSGLKAVWTTSSPLPDPLRNNLQDVFQSPVYSQYGCCECGHLAAECSQRNGMHIHSDWRHLEFVDDEGRNVPVGTVGDVIVSDLYATQVPLIRYSLGDKGSLLNRKCSCGINLPLMSPVKGRVSEAFPMPDGSKLSGDYLTTIFDRYPDSIRAFRVHQNMDYSIRVEYVIRNTALLKTALEDVQHNLSVSTKKQVDIQLIPVDNIPHDRGKTRYVTSDVKAI